MSKFPLPNDMISRGTNRLGHVCAMLAVVSVD